MKIELKAINYRQIMLFVCMYLKLIAKNIVPIGIKEINILSKKTSIPIIRSGVIDENNFNKVLNS